MPRLQPNDAQKKSFLSAPSATLRDSFDFNFGCRCAALSSPVNLRPILASPEIANDKFTIVNYK